MSTTPSPPLANTITLGVRDVGRQRAFYQALGWPIAFDSDDFVVFELRGALLALFGAEQLGRDARAAADPPSGRIRSAVIIIADSAGAVDDLAERVRQAGGTVTKDPVDAEFFEGRDCYFTDPEGHFWEIAWTASENPVVTAARRAAGL